MSKWKVFIEYEGDTLEVVTTHEFENEDDVVKDVLEFVQVWAERVND